METPGQKPSKSGRRDLSKLLIMPPHLPEFEPNYDGPTLLVYLMQIEAARYCARYPQVNDGWQEVAGRRQRSESCLGRGVCFYDDDAVRGSIGVACKL
ncbi:hypothetical protein ACWX0K_09545 [Nitrobacteraceae bacterium UC4446_H13]